MPSEYGLMKGMVEEKILGVCFGRNDGMHIFLIMSLYDPPVLYSY